MQFLFHFSCVDNNNCEGLIGIRTGLLCDKATQTCCHESKIKQPNEDTDYYYDPSETEESCSSFAAEGFRLVGWFHSVIFHFCTQIQST